MMRYRTGNDEQLARMKRQPTIQSAALTQSLKLRAARGAERAASLEQRAIPHSMRRRSLPKPDLRRLPLLAR